MESEPTSGVPIDPFNAAREAQDRRNRREEELWSVLCDNVNQGFMTPEDAEVAFKSYLDRP